MALFSSKSKIELARNQVVVTTDLQFFFFFLSVIVGCVELVCVKQSDSLGCIVHG